MHWIKRIFLLITLDLKNKNLEKKCVSATLHQNETFILLLLSTMMKCTIHNNQIQVVIKSLC